MIYIPTENTHEFIVKAETLAERLRLAWRYIRQPNLMQVRVTFTDGGLFIIKHCKPIMNETKNLVKVRE